jgi:integrase
MKTPNYSPETECSDDDMLYTPIRFGQNLHEPADHLLSDEDIYNERNFLKTKTSKLHTGTTPAGKKSKYEATLVPDFAPVAKGAAVVPDKRSVKAKIDIVLPEDGEDDMYYNFSLKDAPAGVTFIDLRVLTATDRMLTNYPDGFFDEFFTINNCSNIGEINEAIDYKHPFSFTTPILRRMDSCFTLSLGYICLELRKIRGEKLNRDMSRAALYRVKVVNKEAWHSEEYEKSFVYFWDALTYSIKWATYLNNVYGCSFTRSLSDTEALENLVKLAGSVKNLVELAYPIVTQKAVASQLRLGEVMTQYHDLLTDGEHKKLYRIFANRLQKEFPLLYSKRMEEVTTADLQDAVNKKTGGVVNRCNFFRYISTAINWANKTGVYTPMRLPTLGVILPKNRELRDRVYMVPEQMKELLVKAWEYNPSYVLYIIVVGFCGARSSEALKYLRIKDIRWEEKELYLLKGKTGRGRVMSIPDCAYEWLLLLKNTKYSILDESTDYYNPQSLMFGLSSSQLSLFRKEKGIKWDRNLLRHSFISHHISLHKNADLTATYAGTSVAKIESNYKGVVNPSSLSKEYFELSPKVCGIVK